MFRTLCIAISAAGMIGGMALSAEAMPLAGGLSTQTAAESAGVTLVAGGCGIGFHRGPYGGCRPNRVYRVAPRRFYGPRCVVRRGPYGHLRRICRW